ncbi:hypothetical protein CQW23_15071 [Capsicum baccatum]|uniref:Uncharacterized protein n=1 Tax=Capsicum baccatum TaxID=33114 RepID=A0A2G2WKY2_CAPBA|nr:hypothetical protein CQW23_15071 [Capsicum baccatum]
MERLDLISKLPLPILDHILSFLAIKDAAKTSVLSETWNSAWNSLSSLEFGPENFGSPYYVSYVFVDQILAKRQKHKISIQRFNMIYFPNYLNVDNWFKILVECNIKEFATQYPGKKLPEVIFAAKALNVLRLGFYGPISLQVAGTLPKLRLVYLESSPPEFQMVDIAAPNLKGLYIRSDSWDLNLLININACVALKRLKLSSLVVTDQCLENLLSNVPNLEILDIYYCSSLRTVKISSNRLKYLTLVSCNNLIEVDLDTPNLLGFLSDVRYGNDIVNPLPAFHLKASPLLEVSLELIPETLDTHWYSELMKSLSSFNHSKAISIFCDDYKFTYRDAADDEDGKPCCASLPWKCWRHELKKVELQQNIGLKERLDLEKYFLTNADMLEIIDEQREWRNHSDPVVWQLELPSWW